jgi:hypothetical protein
MTASHLPISALARASHRPHVLSRIHDGREQDVSVTRRHMAQGSPRKNPGQTGYRASQATHARECRAGDVVNDGETLSETTLAENSSPERDEQHRRTDRRAGIVFGKDFGPHLEVEGKLADEGGQRHRWNERPWGQRPCRAVRGVCRFATPYHDGAAGVRAERGMSDVVIVARRMARTGDRRSQP